MSLSWRGKPELGARETGPELAKALPAPLLERPEGALHAGDNLTVLRALARTHREAVTLAYMDPPFLTGRTHELRVPRAGVRKAAFEDRWDDRAAYLESVGARLAAVRELLAPHGCVVIHVDPQTSHYVKVLCDEIFGEDAFASEIVWRYRRWPARTPNFQRVHDVLLRYRKDPSSAPRFSQLYEPLAASTLATWGTTKQRAVFDDGKGADGKGTGAKRRLRSTSTGEPSRGVPMGDVWDIGVIAPIARERTGYPTQKPEALLERLVTALSGPEELVLDPYAGSGTTLAVAARLGRRWLGIDESPVALEVASRRLAAIAPCAPDPRPHRLGKAR